MLSVQSYPRQFYQDQLYNPHAGADGMRAFYRRVISDHWVYRSAENGLLSEIHSFPAFSLLAATHRIPYWDRRVYTTPAFHRIPVLAFGYINSYIRKAIGGEPWWARKTRIRVFKVIRVRVCRQWLARVRVHIGRAPWCDDSVADVIVAQLEAWFAAVPHEEVQWSEYDDWLRRYRVIQW